MTRVEALLITLFGLAVTTAAVTWMYGGWGLLGGGLAFVVYALIIADIKEG